jgi:membrane protein DedA with SNARE-associated domain
MGYKLGSVPIVRQHFDKVIVLIIVISLTPAFLELLKARRARTARSRS